MTIRDISKLLNCKVLGGDDNLEHTVHTACGSDLMSDVLAFVKDQAVLLTGLLNPQVVRTAEMMDIVCIVFVRGKTPSDEVVKLANERNIATLSTTCSMFEACGRLYADGLRGGVLV
ncbi:MAG: DRTGG domain-containing protein [Oscillospiraceae bacterium]|nr:DRTGG domain-containing protein [Oscillospiraceae bacterium]